MLHQYRCQRCGYHYGPDRLEVGRGLLFPVCIDRPRCDGHIAQRKADREALKSRARPDYDPRIDHPERFTEGPI